MTRRLALALCLLAPAAGRAQGPPAEGFHAFLARLHAAATLRDAAARTAAVDALWAGLRTEGRIPFIAGDSVVFLWRGEAARVAVAGDHTGWRPDGREMVRLRPSDVWVRAEVFDPDARVDYKLVVNDSLWIEDPENPHRQFSGTGTFNSEVRMPAWTFPEETRPRPGVPRGTLSGERLLPSDTLGYAVRYRVYAPAGYDTLDALPTLYVTDGHEYADERMGALPVVLDNLIHEGRAAPVVVVFVDPRNGPEGENLRHLQYVRNPAFAHFLARELVPAVDAAYRTRRDREARAVLGTSLGGLFATALGLLHPDVFGRLAIQSPAYWVTEDARWGVGPSIYHEVRASTAGPFTVYLSTGTLHDGEGGARRMRDLLRARGDALTYREVPQGHSWGQWRGLLDEVLEALFPGPAAR